MKFNEKRLIYLRFFDHGKGGFETGPECSFVGWLIKETDKEFVLSPWILNNMKQDVFDDNLEKFFILKSAIIKKKVIKLS